jgi:ribosome-binding factor A
MSNPRFAKTAEQIKFIVAEMLQRRIKDPRLGFVTVTDVRISGDGHEATIFYTVLGDAEAREESAVALASASGLLRSTVGKRLGLKFTPTLAFVLDAVEEEASRIEEALARAKAADEAVAAQAASAHYAGEADPYRKPADAEDDLD